MLKILREKFCTYIKTQVCYEYIKILYTGIQTFEIICTQKHEVKKSFLPFFLNFDTKQKLLQKVFFFSFQYITLPL